MGHMMLRCYMIQWFTTETKLQIDRVLSSQVDSTVDLDDGSAEFRSDYHYC